MFRESFKYYKSKNPPPAFTDVLDFNNVNKIKINKINIVKDAGQNTCNKYGLKPTNTWEVYELVDHPGFIFIKNPFIGIGQRYWVIRSLKDYSKKTNWTNLDSFNLMTDSKEGETCQNSNKLPVNKLRWATLGYHHDWDTKVYSEENKGDFPGDLADISEYIAQTLQFTHFKAEAAIVNYYHTNSTLAGHVDYSEQNLDAPLISFSFGQTAIFLLGGKTKEEKPTAMFLRSGDIVIMSESSRLCYHGVPKIIIETSSSAWDYFNQNDYINMEFQDVVRICKDDILWNPFRIYLNNSRININVRQVLKRGQKKLNIADIICSN